jgi:hypothetical protein
MKICVYAVAYYVYLHRTIAGQVFYTQSAFAKFTGYAVGSITRWVQTNDARKLEAAFAEGQSRAA